MSDASRDDDGLDAPVDRTAGELGDERAGGATRFDAVYFEHDSSSLSASARDLLAVVAAQLTQRTAVSIEIQGHTDEDGTDEYNIALGERRAMVIRDYLVRLGVDGGRLLTISYGEARPAAPGTDPDSMAQNRRGEFAQRQ